MSGMMASPITSSLLGPARSSIEMIKSSSKGSAATNMSSSFHIKFLVGERTCLVFSNWWPSLTLTKTSDTTFLVQGIPSHGYNCEDGNQQVLTLHGWHLGSIHLLEFHTIQQASAPLCPSCHPCPQDDTTLVPVGCQEGPLEVPHSDPASPGQHNFLRECKNHIPLRSLVLLKVLCFHLVISKVHLNVGVKTPSDVHVRQVTGLDHTHKEVLHLLNKVICPSLLTRNYPATNNTSTTKCRACLLQLEVNRLLWTWGIHPLYLRRRGSSFVSNRRKGSLLLVCI
ncbi:hypothetical protein EJB05_12582 [Eragrostis curvula]|uniref:Uncharacterized protein n=1 Tax=Eragrostis curvula TaxID=38414 RepID=A0A5J9VUC0_9POAL|nr:hypothetical protein EJB05_12582 [Eragrostis curvula]